MVFHLKPQASSSFTQKDVFYYNCCKTLLSNCWLFLKKKKTVRSHHYIKWVELFFEDDFFDVDQQDFIDEKEHCLIEAMNLLSKKQHEILRIKFYQKLKSREIAKQLNVTAGNIDNESAKAYKELWQILRKKLNSRLL